MGSPITSEDFSVVDFSGDMCSQLQQLLATNNKLKTWFDWAFNSQGEATQEFLVAIEGAGIPIGGIVFYPALVVPAGWLICNGQTISRTTYARLFAKIGTIYGAGDGSTTFAVPNMEARFPLGTGNGRAVGVTGGAETHTLTINEMPAHTHPPPAGVSAFWGYNGTGPADMPGGNDSISKPATGSTGGDAAHNNMPPYLVGLWLIRY